MPSTGEFCISARTKSAQLMAGGGWAQHLAASTVAGRICEHGAVLVAIPEATGRGRAVLRKLRGRLLPRAHHLRACAFQVGVNASEGGLFSLSGRISVYAPTVLAARLLPSFSCA